jgi:plasmid rolling circle replication initiator protein Rep
MSTLAGGDLLTVPIDGEGVKTDEYLSDLSPHHRPWDVHRSEADDVMGIYANSSSALHHRYAERVENCSQVVGFAHDPLGTKKNKLRLKTVWLCHLRHCPVCQWRKSLQWQAKVYQALPLLRRDYPDTRFLFMTLTIRNCDVKDLRVTLEAMAKGWQRLTQLRTWPARGWVRAVEITRSQKYRTAHPHYHCLLMVAPAYFQGDYLKQEEWAKLWQQSMRLDYKPPRNMWAAVAEILKYAVKPSDMVRDHDWFLTLTDQLHHTRSVAIGGIMKRYIKQQEQKTMLSEPGEEPAEETKEQLYFGWKQKVRKYQKIAPLTPGRI